MWSVATENYSNYDDAGLRCLHNRLIVTRPSVKTAPEFWDSLQSCPHRLDDHELYSCFYGHI